MTHCETAGQFPAVSFYSRETIAMEAEHRRRPNVDLATHRDSENGETMNKDRVEGSLEQAKGQAKEVAGKATGDAKLEAEGKAQKAAGKVQNIVGGMKDAAMEAVED
ncbi:CsbD family protein [Microbacteriaceae bacterium K1510]|nr:CsbD family protein [Microbacteriaceae bacterium K1510]